MKRVVLFFIATLVALAGVVITPGSASAHFLIRDEATRMQALFHVTPDHDPVAGQESIVSFDFSETNVKLADYALTLSVQPTKSALVSVPFEVTGNVIVASYVFPAQGFYTITLKAASKADGTVSNLSYGQRVSRGVESKSSEGLKPIEIGVMVGVGLIAAAAIIYSVRNDRVQRKERYEKHTD